MNVAMLSRSIWLVTPSRRLVCALYCHPRPIQPFPARRPMLARPLLRTSVRSYSSQADEIMENLQELYHNAKDEFEMAAEETEKKTVYAADDRAAAREELIKLQDAYKAAVDSSPSDVSAEIQRRTGQRIRELENAVQAMEEMAMED